MEIKKVGAYSAQSLQKIQESQRHLRGDEKVSPRDAATAGDKVELSKGYQSMTQLSKVAMERSDVRTEKVDQLRKLIENNNYQVDPEEIASKIVADSLY